MCRREQKRRDREAAEAKERARAEQLQRKRNENIQRIETDWLLEQEQLRAKDDAMVQFIRTARERRAAERQMVRSAMMPPFLSSPVLLSLAAHRFCCLVQEKEEMEEKAQLEEKLKR